MDYLIDRDGKEKERDSAPSLKSLTEENELPKSHRIIREVYGVSLCREKILDPDGFRRWLSMKTT